MSLSETCMLVSLRINLPPQTKLARAASDDVEFKYKTARRQGRVTKNLFSSKDIKPLSQAANKARTLFNELTLPYDAAHRIMPSAAYFDFVRKMSVAFQETSVQKHNFIRDYHIILMRSEHVLGDLWDEADYPTLSEMENRINFTIESSVVPSTTAFDDLAGLTEEAIEELKAQAVAGQQAKVEEALNDLFKRLFKSLHKASVKLADEDGVFRDTLIGNINNAIEAVENLNLTQNPDLIYLAEQVREALEDIHPEDLRKDKELRKEVAEQTRTLVDKVGEFF